MPPVGVSHISICLGLTRAIGGSQTVEQIYDAALNALADGLGVSRSAILLYDTDGVMRFRAWRGLSDEYRRAVEGHSPWPPGATDPQPVVVSDVTTSAALAPHLPAIRAERIAAMAFIPLVSLDRIIGKFMLYYDAPRTLADDDLQLAGLIASQVAFAVERRRAEDLARRSEERAEEASRLKDEFLATLSHELRTPLNAIVGWVQMLQLDPQLAPRTREAVDVIGRNARQQAQLIEDILDVSRIISGKLEIERQSVPLAQLIETAVAGIRPAADKKRIAIATELPQAVPAVDGDAKRLHQVFGNILSNAVKFTPDGGRVAIRCVDDGSSIQIRVQDSGAGIDPAFLPYVFDRFRQAERGSTRRHSGLGLGLAIARHLIEQHGGDIQAESDGPGHGTTVTIRLPATGAPGDAGGAGAAGGDAAGRDDLLANTTVVVVDDQADSRELLAALFERCGAEVVQCESARAALAAVKSRPIQLMVADLAMPEVDGYELIRHVRAIHPDLPAVAVSACARSEDRGRALSSGYSGYCAKPIEQAHLLQSVRNAMRE